MSTFSALGYSCKLSIKLFFRHKCEDGYRNKQVDPDTCLELGLDSNIVYFGGLVFHYAMRSCNLRVPIYCVVPQIKDNDTYVAPYGHAIACTRWLGLLTANKGTYKIAIDH
jgi:hypothetical protein